MPEENDLIGIDLTRLQNALVSGITEPIQPPQRPVLPDDEAAESGQVPIGLANAQDFGGAPLPTITPDEVLARYPADTKVVSFKLRYDPTKIKSPLPATRNDTSYTIVDRDGVAHKSDDKVHLVVDYVPAQAVDTFADLRETDHWTSATESPIMAASEAVKVKESLELLKIWVKLINPNAKKETDEDIIKARKDNLQKAIERNSSPAEIEKAERAAKHANVGFQWKDKVLDAAFIKTASGDTEPEPPPPPEKKVVQEYEDGAGRFEDLLVELENKGDTQIEQE